MGLHAVIVNHDQVFDRLTEQPVIANDYDISRPQELTALQHHVYQHYRKDTIDEGASCYCEKHTGTFKVGYVCEDCNTPVMSTTDQPLTSKLWIRAPKGVKALINPQVWLILSNALTLSDFNVLEWLTNTSYSHKSGRSFSQDTRKRFQRLQETGIKRGLNNFITHFDSIISTLFEKNIINTTKVNKDDLWDFLQTYRNCIFSEYIPIPSRRTFVVESNVSGTYLDEVIGQAMDAVLTIAGVQSADVFLDETTTQNRTVKAIRQLGGYYAQNTKDNLQPKPGVWRRHVLGTRSPWSARGVITSLSGPHRTEELHLPWGMAVQLLKYHLLNKLIARENMTPSEGVRFLNEYTLAYHPLLDSLFQELVMETKDSRGIAVLFNRNPTLQRGSIQRFFVTKIKTDPRINTISMPTGALRSPN